VYGLGHAGEILAAGNRAYDALLNLCVWAKDKGGMGSFYRSQHELIFVFRNGKASHRNNVQLGKFGRNRTNVWQYPGVNTLSRQGEEGNLLALHPTVKPVSMVADALLDCTRPGGLVLDSFLGSGSTLIVAERTGRICYGIELDPSTWTLRSNAGSDTPAVLLYTLNQAGNWGRWLVADNSDEIGFGKPPKHTQFRKGQSGNPKGRPKGSKNIIVLIRKALEEKVTVKGPGGTHSMSTFEAALMQQANKAASGDIRAFREVLRVHEKVQEQEPYLNAPEFVVNFIDPPNRKPSAEENGEK
jgi:hypothetical protein